MPRPEGGRDRGSLLDQFGVVAGVAYQSGAGRLAERDAETQVRADPDQRLVEVVDGLDEVGLPDDDVGVVRLDRSVTTTKMSASSGVTLGKWSV